MGGVLFDASSQDDLTAELQALLDEPDRASRIGWDEVVTQTEAVYRSVARPAAT